MGLKNRFLLLVSFILFINLFYLTSSIISPGPILNDAITKPQYLRSSSLEEHNSDYLYGNIIVSVILPESNGLLDYNSETWTEYQISEIKEEINNGLNWWIIKKPSYVDLNITIIYSIENTSYEPIIHNGPDYYGEGRWIDEILSKKGFNDEGYYFKALHYNNYLKEEYNADWAFSVFVVNSNKDPDGKFLDNYFAYAYLNGPFMVMTYDNDGYGVNNMDAVFAHEFGHIFGAGDEYSSSSDCQCNNKFGFLNIENQNCENNCKSNEACIMRGGISPFLSNSLDYYSAAQIGWRDENNNRIVDVIDNKYNLQSDKDNDGLIDYWDYLNIFSPTNNIWYNSIPIINASILDKSKLTNISLNSKDLDFTIFNNQITMNLTEAKEGNNNLSFLSYFVGSIKTDSLIFNLDTINPIIKSVNLSYVQDDLYNNLTFFINYSEINPAKITINCSYNYSDNNYKYFYSQNLSYVEGNYSLFNHIIQFENLTDNSIINYCLINIQDKVLNEGNFIAGENYSLDECIPNFIEEINCNSEDSLVVSYNDTKSCFTKTNLTSDLKENKTKLFSCDYNNDGFIGNISNINSTLNVSLENKLLESNLSNILIKKENKTLIEFNYNLSEKTINLAELILESKSDRDYANIIITGLNLTNVTKTVFLDVKLSTSGLCIKDQEILSINEISNSCTGINETWIQCPGSKNSYICSVINNTYKVEGLKHSGIKEQTNYCGDNICKGETCSSCSLDCGVCPSEEGGTSSGGSSSNTNQNSGIIAINITNQTKQEEGKDNLNEGNASKIMQESPTITGQTISPITGAVVGTLKNKFFWAGVFIVLISIAAIIVYIKRKKYSEKV